MYYMSTKTTQMFISARKYKLIKLLTFICVSYKTDVGNFFVDVILLFLVFVGNCRVPR